MNQKSCSLWLLLMLAQQAFAQLPPIGQWREHFDWLKTLQLVESDNKLWCATNLSFFSVDAIDQSITTYGKLEGLSSLGVQQIGWDITTQTLVAGYLNGSIDLVKENKIQTIAAFQLANVSSKKIHAIFCKSGLAYIGTEMGVMALDLQKKSVLGSYVVGNNGEKKPVWAVSSFHNRIYELGPDGLKSAAENGPNLSDFRNWSLETLAFPNSNSRSILQEFNGGLMACVNDSLFYFQNNGWKFWFADGQAILDLKTNDKQLLLTEKKTDNSKRTLVLDATGIIVQVMENKPGLPDLRQTVFWKGNYWFADAIRGLTKQSGSNYLNYLPQGPNGTISGPMETTSNQLWAVSGTQVSSDSSHGIFLFSEDRWSSFKPSSPLSKDFFPISALALNSITSETWAGSMGAGLVKLDAQLNPSYFSQGTGLESSNINNTRYLVSGLCMDEQQQLWISNSESLHPLKMRKQDGKWYSFTPPYSINQHQTGQLLADDFHQIWIQLPESQGVLVFNYGSSVENPADDRWKWFKAGKGSGNLPDNEVRCMTKDQNGFVWIGTRKGVAVVQCTDDLFGNRGCEAVIPIVQNNSFAGYLLGDEEVNCLAIDGANRIWAGTNHGLWLLNEDGEKTIYRFTSSNSPLPSDSIYSLKIDGTSGEVFIASALGLVSFRSTATQGIHPSPQLQVFPQPVPPEYRGSIAIKGMANESVVKITELDGRLVYETRSLGGQAIWNGLNYKGERIATGVYLVWVSADGGQFRNSTKIVFIGK